MGPKDPIQESLLPGSEEIQQLNETWMRDFFRLGGVLYLKDVLRDLLRQPADIHQHSSPAQMAISLIVKLVSYYLMLFGALHSKEAESVYHSLKLQNFVHYPVQTLAQQLKKQFSIQLPQLSSHKSDSTNSDTQLSRSSSELQISKEREEKCGYEISAIKETPGFTKHKEQLRDCEAGKAYFEETLTQEWLDFAMGLTQCLVEAKSDSELDLSFLLFSLRSLLLAILLYKPELQGYLFKARKELAG